LGGSYSKRRWSAFSSERGDEWDISHGKKTQVPIIQHRTELHRHVLVSIPELPFTCQAWNSHCLLPCLSAYSKNTTTQSHSPPPQPQHSTFNFSIFIVIIIAQSQFSQCSSSHYFAVQKSHLNPHFSLRCFQPKTTPAAVRLPEIRPSVTWGTPLSILHPLVVTSKNVRLLLSASVFENCHLVLLLGRWGLWSKHREA